MGAHLKIFIFFAFSFLNSVVAQRLSSQTEWRALLELRSSLGIAAKDWRKKANPCLNWTGIECGSGRVIGINLSGLRRTRQGNLNPRFALDSLPSFPLLSAFNSTGFSLPGSIPDWLGERLSNLEVLDLSSCSIYGPLPSSIGNLSRLRSLHLSNNSIAGTVPTALGKLLPLSVLDLSRNLLTGQIPSEIASLMNLSKLDLSSNFLSGGIPLEFGSLSSLEHLNLSNNNLNAVIPAQLGNISRLIELDLGLNSFFGSLPDDLFQKLVRLDYLVLSRNYFVGALPDALWSMSRLKYLDVSGNNLTGAFSIHVAFLNITGAVFNFSNNQFYGNLSHGIGKLHTIDISSNYFKGSAPNDSRISIILTNNCFLGVLGQRNGESCMNFYSERGISFGNETVPLEPPLLQPAQRRKRLAYVMVGVFGGLGFIVVLITLILLLSKACNSNTRKIDHQNRNAIVSRVPEGSFEPSPKALIDLSSLVESFTHEQMLLATHNFSTENFIKDGHSGDIFRGNLENGLPVVIKRVDLSIVRKESFMSELDIFGKVMHPRLVPLVGHCLEDEQKKYLVYKYMPNGDLSNAFYRLTNVEEDLQSLDWITRLKIAIGAAEAISYLHHECSPHVVHRDIQASSILLDDKYEVRLGSFSEACSPGATNNQNIFARLLPTPQTSGRRPSGSSSITCAYDVYCFGKVLLELVTGRLGLSSWNNADAKQWLDINLPLISIYEKELVIKIVDQSLIIDEDLLEEVWAVAIVAKSCLNPRASRRPSMRHVVKALENPFKVVREENFSSSRQSWMAAIFGSWHHSSSDGSNMSGQTNREIIGGLREMERGGSRGSGGNEHSASHKRSSSDVFPEPMIEIQDETARSV